MIYNFKIHENEWQIKTIENMKWKYSMNISHYISLISAFSTSEKFRLNFQKPNFEGLSNSFIIIWMHSKGYYDKICVEIIQQCNYVIMKIAHHITFFFVVEYIFLTFWTDLIGFKIYYRFHRMFWTLTGFFRGWQKSLIEFPDCLLDRFYFMIHLKLKENPKNLIQ